jgi:maleylpyruvate isomerase
MPAADDSRELDRDVELAADAHQRLLATLDRLVAAAELDVASASRLSGWTRGHVLAHIVNSADGHVLLLDAAAQGNVGYQYPHGVEGRERDIERDAPRPAAEHVDAVRRSIWALEGRWATSSWQGRAITPRSEVNVADLPFLRLREVAIHSVDLDIGYELDDLPDAYVRLELRRMEMLWKARQPMGLTPLPQAALQVPPERRLGWLLGRTEIQGLGPAGVF